MKTLRLETSIPRTPDEDAAIDERFGTALTQLRSRTDRFLAKLLLAQWIAMMGLALLTSPRTWEGRTSSIHVHVWAALLLGGAIVLYPAWLGWRRAGETLTRHLLVSAQMLVSALLIHLSGGRIETHFHVFGSLALLAFYRDPRVFITATVVVYVDHLVRGVFWPESVFGVVTATFWRSLEHAGWVLFEVLFLVLLARTGLTEMRELVARQIGLEKSNDAKEQEVQARTRELAASEEQFRSFFRDSPIGLYRCNPEGQLLLANPALLSMLGFESLPQLQATLETQTPFVVFDEGRPAFFRQLAGTSEVLQRDATCRRRDGTVLQIRESGRAVRGADGTILRLDGTIEDTTHHRQLEERYRQAQKVQAIGQLAGGVAHDFNNILTVINGYSQVLLESNLGEEDRRIVGTIRDAGQRAATLTRQLLAYSRKQLLQPRVIQLDAVTAEMEPMLRRLVGENIRIRTIATSDLAAVRADPGQIQQVVMNLVVNARDAMPGGGQLTIETANVTLDENYARTRADVPPGDYVMLAVSDTGCGMTPEVQARLFEPFFTTKAPGHGTGLGLATSHGIVKQSGGHIVAYSELGHGTTFKVYLPRVAAEAQPGSVPHSAPQRRGSGQRILLVEDDPDVRLFGRDVLRGLGYQVDLAANGLEALQQFKAQPLVDLVVTDVIMPNLGGRQLADQIRCIAPQVKVLFTSGYTFDALGESQLPAGSAFLAKPYSPQQLAEKVHACLQSGPRTD